MMTRYDIHFRHIWRRLKRTKRMLKALDILERSHLTAEHKEDLWAIWLKNHEKRLGWA